MDEAERIRTLRDEGRISGEQAERLLAALDQLGATEHADGSEAPHGMSGATSAGAADAPDAMGDRPSTESSRRTQGPHASAAGGTEAVRAEAAAEVVSRWVRVGMFAGSVRVSVDPAVSAPSVQSDGGEVDVVETPEGWRVEQRRSDEGNWIERLVEGVRRARLQMRVPADTGVHLDVKAGDVRLEGVPALRGRLLAGDLDATGLRAVDVAVHAGDVDLEIDPAPGLHRLRLTVGDAKVRLPSHADVRVDGRVTVGDASAPAPFRADRSGVAERLEGVMGEGRARLEVRLATGDFGLKVG